MHSVESSGEEVRPERRYKSMLYVTCVQHLFHGKVRTWQSHLSNSRRNCYIVSVDMDKQMDWSLTKRARVRDQELWTYLLQVFWGFCLEINWN